MSDIEIEIKVRVGNIEALRKLLTDDATFIGENYQKDEYFSSIHNDFLAEEPIKEWLRVRTSGANSITYKNWHYDDSGHSNHCDEYETKIDDPGQLKRILEVLGMKPIAVVEKSRSSWSYKDYEVSIDEVTDLGSFVEVEYKGDDKNPDPAAITQEMVSFLQSVGCGKLERSFLGYPHMVLYPEKHSFEPV